MMHTILHSLTFIILVIQYVEIRDINKRLGEQ